MRQFRPGFFGRIVFNDAVFRVPEKQNALYLTFDDGPDPESTPEVLKILAARNINALFFCNGQRAERYPLLMNNIKTAGHMIGNHGYDHLDGWTTGTQKYLDDISKASYYTSDTLFRPPYGRIRYSQYKNLAANYIIFFWDIMPYDFDIKFGRERSLMALEKKRRPGSVIVLHDRADSLCSSILADFIDNSIVRGYIFKLPDVSCKK